jgi:hypothetical protein
VLISAVIQRNWNKKMGMFWGMIFLCYLCTAIKKKVLYIKILYCGVEQLVARWAHIRQLADVGSSLFQDEVLFNTKYYIAGWSSW